MRTLRATIVQLDPEVPLDRLRYWVSSQGVRLQTAPLWSRAVPRIDQVGDGVIVLGGRMSAHDSAEHPWIGPLRTLLVELVAAEVPTLGICLGHQILAEALGGEVQVAHPGGGEHGPAQVTWEATALDDPVLGVLAAEGSSWVAESHHDAVVTLPAGASSLGSTAAYPNQAFRVGSALGVQFHPEASPQLMGRWAEGSASDAWAMRRVMQQHDPDVARTGRLLTAAFCAQIARRAVAA